jgi:hypothetical protein
MSVKLTLSIALAIAVVSGWSAGVDTAVAAVQRSQTGGKGAPQVHVEGRVETKADPSDREIAIAAATAALFGILFVAAQLMAGRKAGKDERTVALSERYAERRFQSVASKTVSFLTVRDAEECVCKLEAYHRRRHADEPCLPRSRDRPDGPHASVNNLLEVFYFLEDVAAAYNHNDVVRRKLHVSLAVPLAQIFTMGWWFICWSRGGDRVGTKPWRWVPEWALRRLPRWVLDQRSDFLAQLEWTVKALRKRVRAVQDDYSEDEPRLVLCLPPSGDDRLVPDNWELPKRFSRTLTRELQSSWSRPERLRSLLRKLDREAARRPAAGKAWEVVIVSPSTRQSRSQSRYDQCVAERLACCLPRFDEQSLDHAISSIA